MCCDDDEGIEQQYNNQPTNVHVSHQGAQMQVVQTNGTVGDQRDQPHRGGPARPTTPWRTSETNVTVGDQRDPRHHGEPARPTAPRKSGTSGVSQ